MPEIPYPLEPFKIKTVESIPLTTRAEREAFLSQARGNIFRVPARGVTIDLLTDSGTGAMSDNQWAAIMTGDESYASSRSWEQLEKTVQEIFGMPFIVPAHQGRGAEHLLFSVLLQREKNPVIPGNGHFDTTMGNILYAGGTGVDCIGSWAGDSESTYPFKGDIDPDVLRTTINKIGVDRVPLVLVTLTANTAAGQPVSLQNLRDVRAVCDEFDIPLFLDSARFAENAWFIKIREPGMSGTSIPEIVKETFSIVDGAAMSSKKDGLVNIGGLVICRDRDLYKKLVAMGTLFEGFPTYGGQAGRDIAALEVGLREVLDPNYLKWRIGQTKYLAEGIRDAGVPVVWPPGGHAVYINISEAMSHMPLDLYPGIAFQNAIYLDGGVRVCEIGTVLAGRDPETGKDNHPRFELVRLAIPRRVYTQTHMNYVIDTVVRVHQNRRELKGVRFTYEPKVLRHFTAEYEEVSLVPENVV